MVNFFSCLLTKLIELPNNPFSSKRYDVILYKKFSFFFFNRKVYNDS